MSGATNCPETPRQKMIGMMYLVLTAMLALNVSADILNGFTLVNNSLKNTLGTAAMRNAGLYDEFSYLAAQNPGKVGQWLDKAKTVKSESDKLYNYIEEMKVSIAKIADGPEGTPDNLQTPGNLDASGQVGLVEKRGIVLKGMIADYSKKIQDLVQSPSQKEQFAKTFATEPKITKSGEKMAWEVQVFESMPAAATITILSKFQNDIRNSEAEIVSYLKAQIDAGDFRVNNIEAIVIPNSKYVIRGGKYSAQIALSATDSTKKPIIRVNGAIIKDGKYEFGCGKTGTFNYSGQIEWPKTDGTSVYYNFKSDYTVGEPSCTVSADMMNVFYAGIDNPVSISVPGVPESKINASMRGGNLVRSRGGWVAKPFKVGQECVITVTANMDGKNQTFGAKVFRVKALPPPVAFIAYTDETGNPGKYKGSTKFSKALLINSKGVRAELDDADLDVKYKVLGFEINTFDAMGNTIVEMSESPNFTQRQQDQMKRLTKGKKFYISRVKAMGPDNVLRILPPIEVIVN